MTLPVFTFTDFGTNGAYLGQLESSLYQQNAQASVIHLQTDAPMFNPRASSYLLGSLRPYLPERCVVVAVVDPGVGSQRKPLAMRLSDRWFVGPDNGLLASVINDDRSLSYQIAWEPECLSATFHGRDLFAVVAARLAKHDLSGLCDTDKSGLIGIDWPRDTLEIIYLDGYGNAVTGLRAVQITHDQKLQVQNSVISFARTFSDMPLRALFWYENSNGLIEIAQNQGSAAATLELNIGTKVKLVS